MKNPRLIRTSFFIGIIISIIVPISAQNQVTKPSISVASATTEKPSRIVAVTSELQKNFTAAQSRTEAARRKMEDTPAWKDYIILQNQEQIVLFAIMSELGLKVISGNCTAIFLKDGKSTLEDGSPVNSSNGKLDHFECKEEKKP